MLRPAPITVFDNLKGIIKLKCQLLGLLLEFFVQMADLVRMTFGDLLLIGLFYIFP